MKDNRQLSTVLKDLGESSSLHGIPKIISSRQVAVKVLWCILLVGAVGLSTYQIIGLFQEYYSYPVKTSVTLNYAKLPFPAVTICNSNPIRASQLEDNNEMYDILMRKLEADSGIPVTTPSSDDQYDTLPFYFDYLDNSNYSGETSDYLNDSYVQFGAEDGFEAWRDRVLSIFKSLPTSKRVEMGHSLRDMIHQLKYLGFTYVIPVDNILTLTSPLFGNCYIINLQEMSQTSGPAKGLRMVLNIEKDEYIDHFITGRGIMISIHEPGTIPLPEKDSLILNPGYETNIGIKLVKVTRLGGNYGTCTTGEGNGHARGFAYSVPLCHAVCLREYVRESCECTPFDSPDDIEPRDTLTVCNYDDADVLNCVIDVHNGVYYGELICDCPPRCNEDTYSTTISGRKWPNEKYLKYVLMSNSCKRNISSMEGPCAHLEIDDSITSTNYDDYASNFASVNIYFEDLNYETITEEPMYNTMRFLSDLGGAMGFYMGASLLSYVEIFQLVLELFLYCKSKWGRKINDTNIIKKRPVKCK